MLRVGIVHLSDQLPLIGWSLYFFPLAFVYFFITDSDYPAIIRSSPFLRIEARLAGISAFALGLIFLNILQSELSYLIPITLSVLGLLPLAYLLWHFVAVGEAATTSPHKTASSSL